MKRLSKEQVLNIHSQLIVATGGSNGLRDESLLESALNAPFQTFDQQALYPSIQQKATQLAFSLVNNHPFIDGNKRIGVHVMLVFLSLNGVMLSYSQEELIDLGLGLAKGILSYEDLLQWIIVHQSD